MTTTNASRNSHSFRSLFLSVILLPFCASTQAAPAPPPQVPGYVAVQLSRQTINQLEATVFVNGKPERFAIDTGASNTVMNAHAAMKDGVRPTDADSPYGQFQYVKGQTLRIAMVDDLRMGAMDFGRGPISLYSAGQSDIVLLEHAQEAAHMAGLLGADILLHYKTIINVRTRQIFFPIKSHEHSKLGATVAAMGFTRIPLRVENGRGITVPCAIGGKSGRLLVDTGAFATFLDAALASELRMPTQRTQVEFGGFDGRRNGSSVARVSDLRIGDYHLPAQKLFILGSSLSADISRIEETHVFGVLGADLLAAQHGIIDLEDMNLYLK
jgi:predicted aspartyl protease